ncbi:MAG: mechanosensitive ion channel domain-containing protein [Bacteroidota bacterium]
MTNRILNLLNDLLDQFLGVIPNVLGAIVVFFIGWIVSRIITRIIKRLLQTIGIDRLAERLNEIDIVQQNNIRVVPSHVLSRLVYYLLMLIFSIVAAEILQVEPVSQLVRDIINYIPLAISGALVLIVGIVIAEALKNIVLTTTESLGIPSAKIIGTFVFYFVLIMSIVTALSQVGIDTDFLATNLSIMIGGAVAAFALGYGLASKDTMANFLASFYSKNRFVIGDVITVDNVKGEIVHMDSNALTLQIEGARVVIPLSKLTNEKIEIHQP